MRPQGTGAARPKWQRFSRNVPFEGTPDATSARAFDSLLAIEPFRPVSAVALAVTRAAVRPLCAPLPCPACRAKRVPNSHLVTGAQRRRQGRVLGPYSLIQGIKSGKPSWAWPAARFTHQKGRPDGTTRNTP